MELLPEVPSTPPAPVPLPPSSTVTGLPHGIGPPEKPGKSLHLKICDFVPPTEQPAALRGEVVTGSAVRNPREAWLPRVPLSLTSEPHLHRPRAQ